MDVMEKLVELLANYFDIGDSYAYNLTRVKSAFACGTMGFDDFEEFDEETVEDIATNLIANGVTVQEWISVNNMLPKIYDKDSDWSGTVLFRTTQGHIHSGRRKFGRHRMSFWIDESDNLFFSKEEVTHWMPLPQPPKGE